MWLPLLLLLLASCTSELVHLLLLGAFATATQATINRGVSAALP